MKYYLLILFSLSTIVASAQNLPQSFTKKSKIPTSEDSITSLARLSSKFYNYFKSTKTTYQKLDSIMYYSINSSTQAFILSRKNIFKYDTNGNIKNESSFTWDSNANNWIKTYDREYSNNGKTIVVTDYTINSYKKTTTLSFNAIGNLILSTSQNWNYNTNQWNDTIRITYSYNTNNLVSSVIKTVYITATNQFVYEYNDVYTYNSNSKLILYEHKSYNYSTQQWQNFNKTEYTLNSNGDKISEVCSEWYPNWELLCKDDFTYDNRGNVTLEFIYF